MNKNKFFFIFFILLLVIGFFTFFKEQNEFSEVEKRYLDKMPRFTISKYIDGKYQDTLEKALADQFVYSEEIKVNYDKLYDVTSMLNLKNNFCANNYINAGAERSYYGCNGNIIFNPIYNCLPKDDEFFDGYNKLNSIVNTYYYIVDTSSIYDFRKNDYSCNISSVYNNNLKGDYTISSFSFKNFKDYSNMFFKTDHHWNYKGSYKGYKDIMKMLNVKDIRVPKTINKHNNVKFYGSHDQQIKKFDNFDYFYSYEYDLPMHDTFIDRSPRPYGNEIDISKTVFINKNTDLYAIIYGYDYGEIVFDYHDDSKENLLIISNSLDNPIDEVIASHFNKTYVFDSRFYNIKDFKIDKYIEDNNISKALIIADYFFIYDNIQLRSELFTDGF